MLIVWFLPIKILPNLLFRVLCLPGDQSHPVCATINKPSCVLHLLDWLIGSRGFFSLERRPEFWVLQFKVFIKVIQFHIYIQLYIYIYTFNFIYILFFTFFSFIGYHKILSIVPCRNYTISPCWLSTLCIVVCLC